MENETILEWMSPEHHFDRKSNDWYWIFGIIVFGSSFLAFYFKNFLFGIFLIISGLTVGFLSYKETKTVPIKMVSRGIIFNRHFYAWKSFKSFWIDDENPHGPRILMKSESSYKPLTSIPINEGVDLNDVRDILLEFLDEEFLAESIIHKWFDQILARW